MAPLDSDVERERQKSYERPLYKEEVAQLRRDASKQNAVRKPKPTASRPLPGSASQARAGPTPSARSAASAASASSAATTSQKKKEAPQESLVLDWVFGYADWVLSSVDVVDKSAHLFTILVRVFLTIK